MDRGLKRCSTSADVESVHDLNKVTDPLPKTKRKLDNLEITGNQNETFEKKEIKKLRKTVGKLTETLEKLHEIILTRPNLPDISFRKEAPRKEVKQQIYLNECNFGNKDHLGLNDDTLFVRGFDTSLPRHEIKTALWKHFSSCGKVTTVYVPIECATGVALGYAFINLKDHTKGFILSGSLLGGRKLHVMMAKYRDEFGGYSNFRGCQRCRNYQPWLVHRARADSLLEKYRSMEKRRSVGTSFSKFGRFTANIARC